MTQAEQIPTTMPPPHMTESVAKQHPQVTTYSAYGGVGLGHLIGGVVYVSGANGWYRAVDMLYTTDGGQGYRQAVAALCGGTWTESDDASEAAWAEGLSLDTLETAQEDGTVETYDGCTVELGGTCPHGYRSPLVVLGLV